MSTDEAQDSYSDSSLEVDVNFRKQRNSKKRLKSSQSFKIDSDFSESDEPSKICRKKEVELEDKQTASELSRQSSGNKTDDDDDDDNFDSIAVADDELTNQKSPKVEENLEEGLEMAQDSSDSKPVSHEKVDSDSSNSCKSEVVSVQEGTLEESSDFDEPLSELRRKKSKTKSELKSASLPKSVTSHKSDETQNLDVSDVSKKLSAPGSLYDEERLPQSPSSSDRDSDTLEPPTKNISSPDGSCDSPRLRKDIPKEEGEPESGSESGDVSESDSSINNFTNTVKTLAKIPQERKCKASSSDSDALLSSLKSCRVSLGRPVKAVTVKKLGKVSDSSSGTKSDSSVEKDDAKVQSGDKNGSLDSGSVSAGLSKGMFYSAKPSKKCRAGNHETSSSSSLSGHSSDCEPLTKKHKVSSGKTSHENKATDEGGGDGGDSRKTEKSKKKQSKKNADPLSRHKRYLKLIGIRISSYSKTLEGCKSIAGRKRRLLKIMRDNGLKGHPTIVKCKKLREKIERKKELADLDLGNIICESGRGKRGRNNDPLSDQMEPERKHSRIKSLPSDSE